MKEGLPKRFFFCSRFHDKLCRTNEHCTLHALLSIFCFCCFSPLLLHRCWCWCRCLCRSRGWRHASAYFSYWQRMASVNASPLSGDVLMHLTYPLSLPCGGGLGSVRLRDGGVALPGHPYAVCSPVHTNARTCTHTDCSFAKLSGGFQAESSRWESSPSTSTSLHCC